MEEEINRHGWRLVQKRLALTTWFLKRLGDIFGGDGTKIIRVKGIFKSKLNSIYAFIFIYKKNPFILCSVKKKLTTAENFKKEKANDIFK